MDENGRIISLDINIGDKTIHLVNTYFPNDKSDQYKFIYNLHPYFHSSHPILWAGDHNITTDNIIDRLPRRRVHDKFGANILQIIQCLDLNDKLTTKMLINEHFSTFFECSITLEVLFLGPYSYFSIEEIHRPFI